MHSAAPPETQRSLRSRWRRFAALVLAVVGALSGSVRLAAQQAATIPDFDAPPAVGNAVPLPAPWLAPPAALPPILTPTAAGVAETPSIQEGAGQVPVLFAIFGAIGGMFVGDWWMQRDCEENCEERGFIGLLAGGLLGGIIGYMIGGGEMPDNSPRGRWP